MIGGCEGKVEGEGITNTVYRCLWMSMLCSPVGGFNMLDHRVYGPVNQTNQANSLPTSPMGNGVGTVIKEYMNKTTALSFPLSFSY